MVAHPDLMTAEELLLRQPADLRSELVRGRMLVREPAAFQHGRLAMRIGAALLAHVEPRGLGAVVAAETGFTLRRAPDTVRAPDSAFISTARLPHGSRGGFPDLAPDLVVEVLSPSDRPGDVHDKVTDWLAAGTRLVWVVGADAQHADVHRPDGSVTRVPTDGSLAGEDVLPGFTLPLRTLAHSA